MELIYDYMKDARKRHMLNALTQKTFGFDFESWVTEGYFEGDYIPYSFTEDGKILANVSANRMCFLQNGVQKNYIQIGTVMTDEAYRGQGLARKLMEHVCKVYEGNCHGIYLFSNLDALDFYRKMGFQEGLQYQYTWKGYEPGEAGSARKEDKLGEAQQKGFFPKADFFRRAEAQDRRLKEKYEDAVRNSAVNAALEQVNKYGLQMFYTGSLNDVYYAEDMDCFAVMEKQGDTLMLQSVISKKPVFLKNVISRIPMKYGCLKLGFAPRPKEADRFEACAYNGEDDYRLFYRGKELESIQSQKLFFPQLSHA